MLSNVKTLSQILQEVDHVRGMPAPVTHKNDRKGKEPHAPEVQHILSDLHIELINIHETKNDKRDFEFAYQENTGKNQIQIRSFWCAGSMLEAMLESIESKPEGAAHDHNKAFLELAIMAYENPELIPNIRTRLRKIGDAPLAYKRNTPAGSLHLEEPGKTLH
ncbi:MAG: hypothetical protein LRY76_07895 [Alphaproteobacteria bacterium]|nr:hypothetical protein [Alphaproteobacteria bacterium]MCD8525802.1 hypothetical protein [Alphaproteobacteria bacterium]MCD8571422.1 hypothetical protein [Alphaproteobacteria bacterium]